MRNMRRIISTIIDPRSRSDALATASSKTCLTTGLLPYSASGRLAAHPWTGLSLGLDD